MLIWTVKLQNLRVDDIGQDCDAHVGHSNDIRRGTSSARSTTSNDSDQLWVSVAANNADSERTSNEEEHETEIDRLERRLDVDTRSLRLCSDHGDVFGTDDRESSGPQSSQEAFESSSSAFAQVLGKGTRRALPVAETVRITLRVTAYHGDKGEEEQTNDQNDLAAGKPEFGLTVRLDGENIDCTRRKFSIYSSEALWLETKEALWHEMDARGVLWAFER